MPVSMNGPGSLVIVALAWCVASVSSTLLRDAPTEPAWPGTTWTQATPEEEGVDSTRILGLLRKIASLELEVHSLLLVRNGRLITEVHWSPYHSETLHDVKSVLDEYLFPGFTPGGPMPANPSANRGIEALGRSLRGVHDHPSSKRVPDSQPAFAPASSRQASQRRVHDRRRRTS